MPLSLSRGRTPVFLRRVPEPRQQRRAAQHSERWVTHHSLGVVREEREHMAQATGLIESALGHRIQPRHSRIDWFSSELGGSRTGRMGSSKGFGLDGQGSPTLHGNDIKTVKATAEAFQSDGSGFCRCCAVASASTASVPTQPTTLFTAATAIGT